jgi:hypothetical protein
VARTRDLLRLAVPAGEPVGDRERGEAQRDQRGDAQAGAQAERGLRARLGDDAGEHAARASHRVVHLAALTDRAEHGCAHRVRGAAGGLADLAERRGVEVKPLDVDADLVGLDPRIGVEPPRGLGQARGLGQDGAAPGITGPRLTGTWLADAVQSERRTGQRLESPSFRAGSSQAIILPGGGGGAAPTRGSSMREPYETRM